MLATPGARPFVIAAFIGRLPLPMLGGSAAGGLAVDAAGVRAAFLVAGAGALLAAAIAVLGRRWLGSPVSPMTRTRSER